MRGRQCKSRLRGTLYDDSSATQPRTPRQARTLAADPARRRPEAPIFFLTSLRVDPIHSNSATEERCESRKRKRENRVQWQRRRKPRRRNTNQFLPNEKGDATRRPLSFGARFSKASSPAPLPRPLPAPAASARRRCRPEIRHASPGAPTDASPRRSDPLRSSGACRAWHSHH